MPSKSKTPSKITSKTSMTPKTLITPVTTENEITLNDIPNLYYIAIVLIILSIGISFFILNWLVKVNKCKCANIDEALYLKEWYMFLIVYQIIAGIYVISTSDYQPSGILYVISTIVSLVAFVMIVRLLLYISKLKEIKCDCGMTTQENIIYYFYIVVYSIMLAVILLALLGALGTLFLHK
jgi:hypothetical protein